MAEAKVLTMRDGNFGMMKIVGVGTFHSAVVFKASYLQLVEAGVREFVIDLSECEHLDSTYLGIILGLGLKLRELGSEQVHVIHANDLIKSLFRGTGLDQIFDMTEPVRETPDEAAE